MPPNDDKRRTGPVTTVTTVTTTAAPEMETTVHSHKPFLKSTDSPSGPTTDSVDTTVPTTKPTSSATPAPSNHSPVPLSTEKEETPSVPKISPSLNAGAGAGSVDATEDVVDDTCRIKLTGAILFDKSKQQWFFTGQWLYNYSPSNTAMNFKYCFPAESTPVPKRRALKVQGTRSSNEENLSGNVCTVLNDQNMLPDTTDWSGYFANPVTQRVRKVPESFNMNVKVDSSGYSHVSGQGENKFGRFELRGSFSNDTGKFEGTKTYTEFLPTATTSSAVTKTKVKLKPKPKPLQPSRIKSDVKPKVSTIRIKPEASNMPKINGNTITVPRKPYQIKENIQPTKKRPRLLNGERKKKMKRCMICVNNGCDQPHDCRGRGGRVYHDCLRCLHNAKSTANLPAPRPASASRLQMLPKPKIYLAPPAKLNQSPKVRLKQDGKQDGRCSRKRKREEKEDESTVSSLYCVEEYLNTDESILHLGETNSGETKMTINIRKFLQSLAKFTKESRKVDGSPVDNDTFKINEKKLHEKLRRLTATWNSLTETKYVNPEGLLNCKEIYKGFSNETVRHGYGVCVYESGHVYEGQWFNGLKDGRGVITDSLGRLVYQGEFMEDRISGIGTLFLPNGDRYDGELKDGLMNGYGAYTEGSGSSYVGDWCLNKRNGFGKSQLADGSYFDGEWCNDIPHGRGNLHIANKFSFNGIFKHGDIEGKGICYWGDGASYEGNFTHSLRDGRGTYKFSNGAVYEGRFRSGKMDGNGLLRMHEEEPTIINDDELFVPITYKSEMRFVHTNAGFAEDGS